MRFLSCLAALVLVACATPASLVGRPVAELASLGHPVGDYPNRDGSRTLAISPGYFSGLTYMADVDAGGTIREVRQALAEDTFQRISAGMSSDQVLRLIGPPADSMEFTRQQETSWEYRFTDAWGYRSLFYVNFDPRGIVVGKLTRRIDTDRFSR